MRPLVNRQVGGPGEGGPRGAAGGGFGGGGGFSSVNDQMTKGFVTVSDTSKHRELSVPNYLPELVTIQTIRRGWATQKMYAYEVGGEGRPVEIKFPAPEGVSSFRRSAWTADGSHLIVDRIDRDTKRRQLFYIANAGSAKQNLILITEHTDDKWQASLSTIYEPHPKDPNVLYFGSEEDGYNHLYLAKVDTATGKTEIKQLTSVTGRSNGQSGQTMARSYMPLPKTRIKNASLIFLIPQPEPSQCFLRPRKE